MKRAFTLIELLVVIAIIAILAGVLMGNYSGIMARVRSAKCETNLKNLANAVGTYATCGRYPYAESAQYIKTSGGTDNQGVEIREFKGWLSWLSQGVRFPIEGDSPASITHCSYANDDEEKILYAITNGAIWTATGKNRDCYRCPVHVEECRKQGVRNPGWSYQMNAYFGCETTAGKADATQYSYIETGTLTRGERVLLFAEIPAIDVNKKGVRKFGVNLPSVNLTGSDGDPAMCGCLRTENSSALGGKGQNAPGAGTASIGFNHVRGNQLVGHVAFADGHVETFFAPANGDFVNLTDWLCQGLDIVINRKNYERVNDSNVE